MNKEEKEAIDILQNCIADYVIGDYCEKCGDRLICEDRNEDCYFQQAIDIVLNLIQKQEKIIDKMAEKINQAYFDEGNMWLWFEKEICSKNKDGKYDFKDLGTRKTHIKEYFKKVEEKGE